MDIKKLNQKINELLLISISLLFPLNQQLHLKPFPNVDGFIIDYLITKISIPEILLVTLTIFNFKRLVNILKTKNLQLPILGFVIFGIISTYLSKYPMLSIYENFILLILFLNIFLTASELDERKILIFTKAIKFWVITLSILGLFQFYFQSSVLNNYYLFGEFPYSEDYYHIKQKGFLFPYLIPPYSIFSHSNIFGGFILISIIVLGLFKKDSYLFHILTVGMLCIIGSLNILLCYFLWLFLIKLPKFKLNWIMFLLLPLSIYLTQFLLSFDYLYYQGNYSIYRRLYMFDLSRVEFVASPVNFILGSGYFNYFEVVKNNLYDYEVVRFFQPPHNLFNLLIWQYGVLFLIFLGWFLVRNFKRVNPELAKFLLVILVASMFDHFFLTNHQIKFFIFLVIPYSLNRQNSI